MKIILSMLMLPVVMLLGGCRSSAESPLGSEPLVDAGVPAEEPEEPAEPRCIEGWPEPVSGVPRPSLTGVEPRVLWRTRLPWLAFDMELVLAGERLAVVGANKLWLLDRAGHVTSEVLDPNSQLGAPPVADEEGNIYFSTSSVFAITPDGRVRWSVPLGPNLGFSQETTSTSKLLLGPGGILYFAATDGMLYALRSRDGSLVWKQEVGLREGRARWVGPGIGDTFFVDGVPYLAATGTPTAQYRVSGTPVQAAVPTFVSLTAGHFEDDGTRLKLRMHFLDTCGKPVWSFPASESWGVDLAGFDNTLLASSEDRASWHSHEGALLKGPRVAPGLASSLGADGTVYMTECSQPDVRSADMAIVAYSPELTELWRLELGKPCTYSGTALADDGVLYFARELPNGTEVSAIQTASPGLAPTAWPTRWRDNRRTGWLSP